MAKQTTTDAWQLPPWFDQLIGGPRGGATQLGGAMADLPTLAQLGENVPGLQIPNLTPDQQAAVDQLFQYSTGGSDLGAARGLLSGLTSGDIGSSPATVAGMKAFESNVLPQVMQQQALQGTATGGAATEAVANAAAGAALPLIQQEISNRQQAVGQYGQLAGEQVSQLQAALEAAGVPREVALEQAQAMFDQAQQKWSFAGNLQGFPLQYLPMTGEHRTTSHGTMSWEDYMAGIGKGLSPSGILGGK